MEEEIYSPDIAEAIERFLTGEGYDFSFSDQCGIFRFGIEVEGLDEKIDYSIEIRAEDYTVYMVSPIGANEGAMAEMARFLCYVNHGLKEGNFELDMGDGEIRYKCFVDCAGVTPTQQMVENSIAWPFVMLRRYIEGIADVARGYATAKAAFNKCGGFDTEKILDALALEEGYVRQGGKTRKEFGCENELAEWLQAEFDRWEKWYKDNVGEHDEEDIYSDDGIQELLDLMWMDDWDDEPVSSPESKKRIFVNFTNHPSSQWEERQRMAAKWYGEIVDMKFPSVDPLADESYIAETAEYYLEKILELEPNAVLCQGEFCLVYRMVNRLKENGVTVLSACSRRVAGNQDGKKEESFQFSRFRYYS